MSYPDIKPAVVPPFPPGTTPVVKVEDLADVDFKGHAPTFGDSLTFNPLDGRWHAAAAPAHIVTWGSATNYAADVTVFHNGGLFRANEQNIGQSPDLVYGDAVFYMRQNKNGSGQFRGAFQFDAVNVVADPTIAPTATHAGSTLPHYTLQYKDDSSWAVWHWNLVVPPGYRPGVDPLPTFSWHNLSASYTNVKTWRSWSPPNGAYGAFVLFIYDNPRGARVPTFRKHYWTLLDVRKDLYALHDVIALNPQTGDVLKYGIDQNWHSESNVAAAAPATPTSPGSKGQFAYDSNHVYLCVDTDQWIRIVRDNTGGW